MADLPVVEYPLITRRNGSVRPAPVEDPIPDFRTHTPSIVGRHYSKIQAVPYTPDVTSVVQDPLLAKRGLKYIHDMLRDDMVTAGLAAIMSTVLTAPRTVPADDTKEAKLEADWFAGMLDAIPGGILTKLFNVDLALVFGFSVQEIKRGLQTTEHSGRRGWTVCKDLLYRQPDFFEFPADPETGELLHLEQRDTWGNTVATLELCDALYYVWDKWVDPFRGRSILRAAYEHWYAKQQFLQFAREQGERVVGKLKISQTREKWIHPDITFKEYAKKVFDNYHFSRGFVELFGTKVEVFNNEQDPQIFLGGIGDLNKAILRAIGVPWLAVEEGLRTGTYALGKVHQDGFLSKLARLKTDMEELIRERLFRPLCRDNAIPERLCPSVDMSPVLEEDKQQSVTLYLQAAAQVPGFAQPADVNWLRERIGVPEVDEDDAVEGPGNPVQTEGQGQQEPGRAFAEVCRFGFCPTGKGGGTDNSCGGSGGSSDSSGGGSAKSGREASVAKKAEAKAVRDEVDRLYGLDADEDATIDRYMTKDETAEYRTLNTEYKAAEANSKELQGLGADEVVARYTDKDERARYETISSRQAAVKAELGRLGSTDLDDEALDKIEKLEQSSDRLDDAAGRILDRAEARRSKDLDKAESKQEKLGERSDRLKAKLAKKAAERHQAEKDRLEAKAQDLEDEADELDADESEGNHSETFSDPVPSRPLTPTEQRIDFAGIESALDGLIASDREELSRLWDQAVEGLRSEVIGWARSPEVSPAQILRKLEGMHLDLDAFRAKLKTGALRAYETGQVQAARELTSAGLPRKFDAQVSPDDPLTPKNYEGLLEAKAFSVARDMEAKVLSSIATTLMNIWETGVTVPEAVAALDTKFTALAAGQLISPGTPGYDFTQPAVQETTVRTLYNSAMNGGRVDVYTQNQEFVRGIEVSAVLDTRTTETCRSGDGLKIPFTNPAYLKFSKSGHYNCRRVAVPVTVVDMGPDPDAYEWSPQSEIDSALAVQAREFPGWV